MSPASTITREDLAVAAAHVAGVDEPLSSRTPRSSRAYLYASPCECDAAFPVEKLEERLSESGIQVGFDWDKKSDTYGLRFVLKADRLPSDIAPFTSLEARREWTKWRARQNEMAAKVVEAAQLMERGDVVSFDDERLDGDVSLKAPRMRRAPEERE